MNISRQIFRHNREVSSTSLTPKPRTGVINRPSTTAVGTIVWLGSEVMFFAGVFAVYFTLKSTSPALWAHETQILNVPAATINTIILVLSSVTCQFGVFAAERMQPRRTGLSPTKWGMVEWMLLSYILGAIFIGGQVFEYATLVHEGFLYDSNPYTSVFFFGTGIHGIHVTVGLIAFLIVIGRAYSAKQFGHREATTAIVVSYYWHFVDVVWIGLFFAIYILK